MTAVVRVWSKNRWLTCMSTCLVFIIR